MSGYTDAALSVLIAQAQGVSTDPRSMGVAQGAADRLARAFVTAEIGPTGPYAAALDPAIMHQVGRGLILEGETVFLIGTAGEAVTLRQACGWTIGGPSDSWIYALDLPSPSRGVDRVTVPANAVFHPRVATDPMSPWAGQGALQRADSTGRLGAALESTMGAEAEAGSATVVPAPTTGAKEGDFTELQEDIRSAKGRVVLVESMRTGWGEGQGTAPGDWRAIRLGFNPPEYAVRARREVEESAMGALGVTADQLRGSANRESERGFLSSLVRPLARLVEVEARRKLHPDLTIRLTPARSPADWASLTRALKNLTDAGYSLADATALMGLS